MRNSGYGRTRKALALLARMSIFAVVVMAAATSVAQARDSDPFNPELKVCTDRDPCVAMDLLNSENFGEDRELGGTTAAGGHPDLTIELTKPINRCPDVEGDGHQNNRQCPDYDPRDPTNSLQIEQDLKKLAINFPPGLLADANAAPYCDVRQVWQSDDLENPQNTPNEHFSWQCANPEAVIGWGWITIAYCDPTPTQLPLPPGTANCSPMMSDGNFMQLPAAVFNERPRRGEQGRLVVLVPAFTPGFGGSTYWQTLGWAKVDVGVTVRSDGGMNVVSDMIPDTTRVQLRTRRVQPDGSGEWYEERMGDQTPGFQISNMLLELGGVIDENQEHPLLTNPTFCNPQATEVEMQGYLVNSTDHDGDPTDIDNQGYGDGKTKRQSLSYQATNCDALPYSPAFAASTDTDAPGSPVALSTVITQKDDEATTKRVEVEFPQGMGINLKSSLKPCGASDPSQSTCPTSEMGDATVSSRLLPEPPRPNSGPLHGKVFLTGIEGNKLSLAMMLKGFVDLRINGKAGIGPDGRLQASFDDLPQVPIRSFRLDLAGADMSLVTNPRRCGDNTTKATFTSHSGKVRTVESKSQIKGCSNPEFDVELSEPAKGKRTGIELEVSSDQKPIKEIKFGLDRHMKLSSKGLGKKRKFGEVSVTTASGSEEAALTRPVGVKQKRKKAFSLKVSVLKGLGVNIYRKAYKSKRKAPFKKKGSKKTRKVIKNRVSVKPLPKNDTSKVSVSLNQDETKLLRNPKNKCSANFIALVKTTDGVKHTLKKKLKLRGKGCGKKKVKRK